MCILICLYKFYTKILFLFGFMSFVEVGTLLSGKKAEVVKGTILSYYVSTAQRFRSSSSDKRTSNAKITQMSSVFFVPTILIGSFVLYHTKYALETISISS